MELEDTGSAIWVLLERCTFDDGKMVYSKWLLL